MSDWLPFDLASIVGQPGRSGDTWLYFTYFLPEVLLIRLNVVVFEQFALKLKVYSLLLLVTLILGHLCSYAV